MPHKPRGTAKAGRKPAELTETRRAAGAQCGRLEFIRAAVRLIRDEVLAEGLPESATVSVLDLLRDEYAKRLDLYKHYLTVAASFTVLYYAVTGSVISYALRGGRWLGWGIGFTIIASLFFAIVFGRAWKLFERAELHIKELAAASGFECGQVKVLTHILKYSCLMYVINSLGLAALLVTTLRG